MVKATAPMLNLSGFFPRLSGDEVETELGAEEPDNVESVMRRDF
jgi:hypothetical protein